MSPAQELRASVLKRQCSPARKNRTRKKKEEGIYLFLKREKNEPLENLKSTESLKRERPKNNLPPKRTKYMKTALQIVKNGDTEDRKAKEQAQDEKANK